MSYPDLKICADCKVWQDRKLFSRNKNTKDGLHSVCKVCDKERKRVSYLENRSEIIRKNTQYVANNKEKVKARRAAHAKKNSKEMSLSRKAALAADPVKNRLVALKRRAKKKGLDFNLEKDDLVIPFCCPILMCPITIGTTASIHSTWTVDRIDNSKGYVKGNVHVVSAKANLMKSSATKEEMINFAEWILTDRKFKSDPQKIPAKSYVSNAHTRAKALNLDFELSSKDIVIPELCPILGIKLWRGSKSHKGSPSIDRIDPSAGYTLDNIQVISKLANTMKNNATLYELELFAKWVLKTFNSD